MITSTSSMTSVPMDFDDYYNIVLYINNTTFGTISGSSNILTVQYSTNGTTWSTISTITSTSTTTMANISLPSTTYNSHTSRIRLATLGATGSAGVRVLSVTLMGNKIVGLPVELSKFYVSGETLLWETESEKINKGFEIESSVNAINWSKIGFVEGSYNSTTNKKYSFKIKCCGKYYYRLKQIDDNGDFTYSNIIFHNYVGTPKVYFDITGKQVDIPMKNTIYIVPNEGKKIFVE
jgi:hypothetical protein